MRSGALAPSHCPTMPPMESPHQLTFSRPSASMIASASRPSRSMCTGPWRHAGLAVAAAVVAHQAEMLA